jgi:hypothetical protein
MLRAPLQDPRSRHQPAVAGGGAVSTIYSVMLTALVDLERARIEER